jgi:hypothetical protein
VTILDDPNTALVVTARAQVNGGLTIYPLINALEGLGTSGFVSTFPGSPMFDGPQGPMGAASFADPNLSADATKYIATVDWGDGTAPTTVTPQVARDGSSNFVVIPAPHVLAAEGKYTLTITVRLTATGEVYSSASEAYILADAPLSGNTGPIELNQAGSYSGGFLNFTTPGDSASDFTATINWGDGTTTAGVVTMLTGAGGSPYFQVSGTHQFSNPQAFETWNGSATVVDIGGATLTLPLEILYDPTDF